MQTQISLLTAMVDDLHSLSRVQAGERPDLREAIDPSDLLARALDAMRIQAEASEITLRSAPVAGLPVICGHSLQLHRVLVNLVENAIRHSAPGGEVRLRARRLRGGLEIEVEDEGDGIPTDDRERIFYAFYGRDRSRSGKRSGLGLAIARATVEAHGGRISVADCSQGARIRIWLPAAGLSRLQPPRGRNRDSVQSCNDLISATPDRLN
jgi:signal transduction histidine kinase